MENNHTSSPKPYRAALCILALEAIVIVLIWLASLAIEYLDWFLLGMPLILGLICLPFLFLSGVIAGVVTLFRGVKCVGRTGMCVSTGLLLLPVVIVILYGVGVIPMIAFM